MSQIYAHVPIRYIGMELYAVQKNYQLSHAIQHKNVLTILYVHLPIHQQIHQHRQHANACILIIIILLRRHAVSEKRLEFIYLLSIELYKLSNKI